MVDDGGSGLRLGREPTKESTSMPTGPEHAVLQVIDEIADVHLGLQADQVVRGEAAGERTMLGDSEERLRRRHGNVQEKADRIRDAESTQLHAHGDHVVVVHPDGVVWPKQGI
jgi:hypothetical protein